MLVANPRKLAMLVRVLQETFDEATRHSPTLSDDDVQDLKERLARLIIDACAKGETKPALLKRKALVRLADEERLLRH